MNELKLEVKIDKPSAGVAIIRTREQAEALKNAIHEELEGLPEYDIFGQSNSEEKQMMRASIEHIEQWLDTGEYDPDTEVGHWLTNANSYLSDDYGFDW